MQCQFTIEFDVFYYNIFLILNKSIRIKYWMAIAGYTLMHSTKRYCQFILLMNLPFNYDLIQYILNIKYCPLLDNVNKLLNICELIFYSSFNY